MTGFVVGALVVYAGVAVAFLLQRRRPATTKALLEERLKDRVLVTLTTGAAFEGLLWEIDSKVWVLREAVAIGMDSTQPTVGVDGEVILPADKVAFAQRA